MLRSRSEPDLILLKREFRRTFAKNYDHCLCQSRCHQIFAADVPEVDQSTCLPTYLLNKKSSAYVVIFLLYRLVHLRGFVQRDEHAAIGDFGKEMRADQHSDFSVDASDG